MTGTRKPSAAPRISLCMIVRDEAAFLPRCLEAARPAVDEIVVVDTGSRDGSAEIAERFGAKVFRHPWNDDFSEARNVSLDRATGEWILWLDADEILQPGGVEEIRRAAENPKAAGYYLAFTNLLDGGKESHFLMPRLFRNRPEIRFVNAIHEQILKSAEAYAKRHGLEIGVCKARVLHYGYLGAEMEKKGKQERMKRLFRKQLQLHPEDPYSWYKYGDFIRKEDREEGIRALGRCVELLRGVDSDARAAAIYAADAAALLANELQAAGRPAEAREALAAVEALGFQGTPNFYFGRACIARLQGECSAALRDFEACLGFSGKSFAIPVQWGVSGPLAHYGIAECKAATGDREGAESAYRKALMLAPTHLEIVLAFAAFLLRQSRPVETLETLAGYLEATPERNELWRKTGEPLLQLAFREVEKALGAEAAAEGTDFKSATGTDFKSVP